jgi:hypothetical protein
MDNVGDLSTKLGSIAAFFHDNASLPFVFLDVTAITGSRTIDKIKSSVLELYQLIESYNHFKTETMVLFQKLKPALLRRQSPSHLGSASGQRPSDSMQSEDTPISLKAQVSLCQSLNKLIFQSVMVYASFDRLLYVVAVAKQFPHLHDHSSQVTALTNEIRTIVAESVQFKRIDCSDLSKQRAVQYLEENLSHNQLKHSVSLLRGTFLTQYTNLI